MEHYSERNKIMMSEIFSLLRELNLLCNNLLWRRIHTFQEPTLVFHIYQLAVQYDRDVGNILLELKFKIKNYLNKVFLSFDPGS